jgi:hypothetical protein
MYNIFDSAAKEILNLSDQAVIHFLNANFSASHPPDTRVVRTNTEYRVPSRSKKGRSGKTIIADEVLLVEEPSGHRTSRYHIEIQLEREAGMAIRMFLYDAAEALQHPVEENGIQTVIFPKSLVIYLEPAGATPDHEALRVRFPDGFCHEYQVQVIKLPELSVEELAERRLLIFAPLYILKLRRKVKAAKTKEKRRRLAAELKEIYRETGEALKREKEARNITEIDRDKVMGLTKVLHRRIYGRYNGFKEDTMDFSELRVIEKLHAELDEERRSRVELEQFHEKAISKVAELEQSREEAVSRADQRLRDTARNILRLGLSVEQVTQATGLPSETVRALAGQL